MRLLLLFVPGCALSAAVACNTADFAPAPVKDCRKVECTCEEDPYQPTCKGFSPEGELDATPHDAAGPAVRLDAESDAESEDSGDDASDAADE